MKNELRKIIKIRAIKGPWFSIGLHVDFKHGHVDLHFIWWVIVIGNTVEPIHCGYCDAEISKDDVACPGCGDTAAIGVLLPVEGWTLNDSKNFDFVIGNNYIVRATHEKGFLASILVRVIDKINNTVEFEIDTILTMKKEKQPNG